MSTYTGRFQYTLPNADYVNSDDPLVNTNGSFTTKTKTVSTDGSTTTVFYNFVFDDSASSNVDGLKISGNITNQANMTITTFYDDGGGSGDPIPMSRNGSVFSGYTGNFPSGSTDIPTLLPNSSLSSTFSGATNFNQDISGWDVSTITIMDNIFKNASSFNQNIGGWNVSSVTNMAAMFSGASAFNQNIGSW